MKSDANLEVIDSSLRSILHITIPIALATMSTNLMCIIDRFMLAGYSVNAMNAAVMSINFVQIFTFFFIGIASSAEVFVGQYNGSKQYEKLAAPVWQMIYLSLASLIIFFPIAYFSDHINMLPPYLLKDGVDYQQTLMYGAVFPPLKMALSSFFIGRGEAKIVTYSVAAGAIMDLALDYIFIYGIRGIIPAMGCKGAAIATVIAEIVQCVMLAVKFFSAKNRKKCKTFENRKFNAKLFWECCRIGIPISMSNFFTFLAWYIAQIFVTRASQDMATVYNIGLSLYAFFYFVAAGINRAATGICSNMIGRGDMESIEETRKVFTNISLIFGLIIAAPMIFFPNGIMSLLDLLPDNISDLYSQIKIVVYIVAIDTTLAAMLMSIWGILLAGGDSKYATIAHQACLWIFVILPITVLYFMNMLNSVSLIFVLIAVWFMVVQLLLHRRYKSMKWYNKLV